MPDVVTETEKSRSEVADYLREFADKLDTRSDVGIAEGDDRRVTVITGNESATVNPPETIHFGVEIDTNPSMLEVGDNQGVTFSLSWDAEKVEPTDEFEVH